MHALGRLTLIGAIIASFLPAAYLAAVYGVNIPADALFTAIIAMLSAYGITYVVEPLAFFVTLGVAGTYISFLAGNIGIMRIPAARVAKDAAGAEDGTLEAELVAICGLAGSVFFYIVFITVVVVAGQYLLDNVLPEAVVSAISSYVLPATFGAVLALFARGHLKITVPAFVFAMLLNWLTRIGALPALATRFNMIVCIGASIMIARVMYNKGILVQKKKN